jgi:hypothetical protein
MDVNARKSRGIALAGERHSHSKGLHMAATRRNYTTWIIIAVVVIVVLAFAGLLPLPGQKDNVTPHSQPAVAGGEPTARIPEGPPPSPSSEPGKGTQPPPGGTPSSSPGSATEGTSSSTVTDAGSGR